MSQMFARFILLLAVLLHACTEAPTTLISDDAGTGVMEVKMGTNPPGQVRHIEALVSALDAAWTAKNAAAYAALFAEDAEHIGPLGNILSGREAIRAQHAFLFSGPFAQSTSTTEVRRIVFLTGTIAIVYLDGALTGFFGLPPGLRATEPGVLRTRVTWVVVKHRGEWQILSQQITPIPPLP